MEHGDFAQGLDELVATFRPSKWTPVNADIYWKIFRDWPAGQWLKAVAAALSSSDYMPKPAELRRLAGDTGDRYVEDERGWPTGCGFCCDGFVYFEVVRHKRSYEHVLACDCAAGDRAARRLLPTLRKRGLRDEGEVRYSAYLRRHGLDRTVRTPEGEVLTL